jgi:uncharacterized lipoprotein YehR (DUF1307 family)
MKQVISVVLALTLALTLCSCGKKDGGSAWQEQYAVFIRGEL